MNLEYEGKEDHYTFLQADELRQFIARDAEATRRCKEQCYAGNSWAGGKDFSTAMQCLTTGDNSLVAASDKILAALEDKLPHTKKYQWIPSVAGPRYDIGEAVRGIPDCMRRRVRVNRNDAPVSIFMDLTSSAMVSADDLLRRGTAILALARILTQYRSVELWGGVSLGDGPGYGRQRKEWSSTLAWRIDTAPLDLARAAFLLASPTVARGLGYGTAPSAAGKTSWSGSWSWGNHMLHVKTQTARLRNAMNAAEMLVIPPIYGTDPLVADPIGWITRELDRLLGQGGEVGSESWNKEEI